MEDNRNGKKILNANQMISELIKNIIIFGLIFSIIYRFVYAFCIKTLENYDNRVLLTFIVIILQTIMISVTLEISNNRAFKNITIYKEDVPKIIKTISFIIIVLLLVQVFSNFASVNSVIDQTINKDYKLQYQERLYSMFFDNAQMSYYQTQKSKAIDEIKGQMYIYLSIVEIGISIVYVSALLIEKKILYEKAIEKDI